MEEIKGYVEHIVYRNEDNGYTVFKLNVILVPEPSKVSDRRWQDGS